MSSGQVSVWIPIVVAVIGIVGVIVGQLINGWREERRARLEADRETQQHWRDERFITYAKFAEIMHSWSLILVDAIRLHMKGTAIPSALLDQMRSFEEQAETTLSRILLVGSETMASACHDVKAMYGSAYRALQAGETLTLLPQATPSPDHVITDAYFDLMTRFREELGTGPNL